MSAFHTFTGSSRRPRNVNLSGQPSSINPFAQGPGGNPARTVNKAHAERQQRQRERDRVQAAKKIQGAFRCYRARQTANDLRREHFDRTYAQASPTSRIETCLPLLLKFHNLKNVDDIRRLREICGDIITAGVPSLDCLTTTQIQQLLRILLDLLPLTLATPEQNVSFLHLIASIIMTSKKAAGGPAKHHYRGLVRLAQACSESDVWREALAVAALAPLQALQHVKDQDHVLEIHRAFAFDYLVGPDLESLETQGTRFAQSIRIEELSSVIAGSYSREVANLGEEKKESLLWLLGHFIQLCSSSPSYQAAAVLESLYVQISTLGDDIRRRYGATENSDNESPNRKDGWSRPLQPYLRSQLSELVSKNTIQNLLSQLSVRGQTSSTMNLLAGYLLTLLRCFPDTSDDIRMLIYQCDLPTLGGVQPIVRNFWELTKATRIYREVLRDDKASTRLLHNYLSSQVSHGEAEEAEWRVLLLFLELYNFTLRVAGDDDFMAGIKPDPLLGPTKQNRLQSCCLSLEAVSGLSVFLKKLSFAIYHDAGVVSPPKRLSNLASFASASSASPSARMEVTTRLDLDGLKSIIPTTMQLVYEKDSRLRFLPVDHWLMTSKFKMDNFIHDVVMEWQRRQEADAEASDEEEEQDISPYGGLVRTHRGAELMMRRRSELARKSREQRLASVGPTIEILQHMPFTIPFETRAKIFKEFVQLDQAKRRGGLVEADMWRQTVSHRQAQRHHGRIKRGSCFDDAYDEFYVLNDGLKEPVFITFLDRFGEEEAGIDGGGVTKEFLNSAITEAFEDDQPWFTRNAQGLYYPNPGINAWHREMMARVDQDEDLKNSQKEALKKLEFLGRLVGKCLYEGILIDVTFAGFFLMRWRTGGDKDYKCTINDLRDVDEDLYKGLINLKNETDDVSDWDLYWTIDDEMWFGDDRERFRATRNLIPDGDTVKVTNENRLAFIASTVKHRLVTQPAAEMRAFVSGLQTMIDPSWLSMFNQTELQRLVGGDSKEIDLEDLKKNTTYSGLYVVGDDGALHPTIEIFWRVMEGFTDAERRDVIKFVTSTPRAPLLGFSQLNPRFAIRDSGVPAAEREEDMMRLPSASTCINLLKLPMYKVEEIMRQKLLQAISSGAGFDLS